MTIKQLVSAAIASVLLALLAGNGWAAELKGVEQFPLDQLKSGLKGTGHTVIRGTQIQTFDVEILELIPKGGFDGGPMILARFSGPVIEQSNGIAGGYSGSPVYIGGKLLGAVSMAIPFTDTHIGGITPIGSMLAALPNHEDPDFSKNTVLPSSTKSGSPLDEEGNKISFTFDRSKALSMNERYRRLGIDRMAAVPAQTPVYSSGLSPGVLERFKPEFKRLLGEHFELMDTPTGGRPAGAGTKGVAEAGGGPGLLLLKQSAEPPLKPGDAAAVALMQGDIEMNAIGTLTYSDTDGRFLCFGHPMLAIGSTNMPVGKGYITWTHKSIQRAFKEGVKLDTVGTMTQDRSAACGGTFGVQPDMLPVRVKIKDMDLGKESSMRFEVIRHPDFSPMLVSMGLSQAAAQVLDRQPGGTLKMSYHIEGAGLKEPLRRTNYYSDDMDVIFSSSMEILPITSLLQTNIYREVRISKIEIMMEITRNRVNASIDDASIIWDKDAAAGKVQPSQPPQAVPGEAPAQAEPSVGPQPALISLPAPIGHRVVDFGQVPLNRFTDRSRFLQDQPVPPTPPGQPSQAGGPQQAPPMGMPVTSPDMPTFAPGDEISVRVRLQPYRTDPIWREFKIKVPADFPNGMTTILVHGGGDLISPSELSGKGRSLFGMGPVIDVKEHDLDAVLDQIMKWPLNNELLVTLVRPYDPAAPQELGSGSEVEKPDNKVDEKYQMEWVVYNGFMLPVNITNAATTPVSPASPSPDSTPSPAEEKANGGGAPSINPESDEEGQEGSHLPFESSVWSDLTTT